MGVYIYRYCPRADSYRDVMIQPNMTFNGIESFRTSDIIELDDKSIILNAEVLWSFISKI